MRIKNLSQLKNLKVGTKIKIIECNENHKYLNIVRKIEKRQTNAFKFEGGGWLYFPKSNEFESWENGFILKFHFNSDYPLNIKYEVLK